MLVKPSDIENTARDIVLYWENSDANDVDKVKILTMVRDFYADRNETTIDQWFAGLCQRILDRNDPQTGFEDSDEG